VSDLRSRNGLAAVVDAQRKQISTLARYLAFCVATGTTFLGHRTTEGVVWYLVLEDKRSEVRRHFRALGATGRESLRFLFGGEHDLLPKLRNLALREHPACIIVDTLQRLVKAKDLNDYAEVTDKLTPIMELARATGATLILVHHAGKADRAGIDTVLGSTALAGSVDNIFLLNRTDRYRLLSSIQRIGSDLEETVIALDGAGHISAGLGRHDADVAHLERAMRAVLENAGGPMTRAEWAYAIPMQRRVEQELRQQRVEESLRPAAVRIDEEIQRQRRIYARQRAHERTGR
jgi:AAA domain